MKKIANSYIFKDEDKARSVKPTKYSIERSTGKITFSISPVTSTTSSNRPSSYKKHKNLSTERFRSFKQSFKTSVHNNLHEDNPNCWWITLLIKDQRIKNAKTVKEMVRKYTKSLPCECVWTAVLEYNYLGHPHVHMLLEGKRFIPEDILRNKWTHGFSDFVNSPTTFDKIANYLIKTYSLNEEDMKFNRDEAEFYTQCYRCLKKKRNQAYKHYQKAITKIQRSKWSKRYHDFDKLYKGVKALAKKECQKQLHGSPVFKSYKQYHPIKKSNKEHKTVNELLHELNLNHDYTYQDSILTKIIGVDSDGQIRYEGINTKSVFVP